MSDRWVPIDVARACAPEHFDMLGQVAVEGVVVPTDDAERIFQLLGVLKADSSLSDKTFDEIHALQQRLLNRLGRLS